MFNAILVDKAEAGYAARITQLDDAQLPEGEVTVRIEYSTINYKDALAISGQAPVIRRFPMVPGIDFAGVVERSTDSRWNVGDSVILNGWGVGEGHFGGLAVKARVRGDWLVKLPDVFTARQAMAIGTAGYTAMLCVMALEKHGIAPEDGEILVTGANGGVGSTAIALLSKLGFRVVASTGRMSEKDHLVSLGASSVIDRSELASAGKPLQKERWAAAIDCVGSHTLANVCAGTAYGGAVSACGLAQGMDFPASVAPFILRGITLYGIDSVMAPKEIRRAAWERLSVDIDMSKLELITREIGLSDVVSAAAEMLAGNVRGRLVVNVNR